MTNTERIQANNADLRECIETANSLPDAKNPVIEALEITENGTYTAPDGVNGYSPVTVNVKESQLDAHLDGTLTEINSDVTTVASYACYTRKKLTALNLPKCTKIENGAFQSCSLLANVNAPKVTSVGTDTFNGCCFASVDFPLLKSVSGRSFASNTKLLRADFPLTTNIGTSCFQNCTALEFVRAAPTFINSNGFNGCTALKTLVLLTSALCSLNNVGAFANTPIASGTGYIYVPRALLSDTDSTMDYRQATNWSTWASQFRALEDYTVDGTTTGELDETKI